MFRFIRILTLGISFLFPSLTVAQTIQTPIDGVMATGKQIAQVRFMLEVYSMIGAGIKYQAPKTKLENAIHEYEETLTQLQKHFPDAAIQTAAKKSLSAWPPVKKALLTALSERNTDTTKKQALFVHGHIRTVIKERGTIKNLLLKKANTAKAQEINAGIEIAASARRLSSHYMLKMWQVPDPTIEEHWKNGMKKYRDALTLLQQSPQAKDPQITTWLKTCAKEYAFFQTLIDLDDFMPVLAQRHANKAYNAAGQIVIKLLGH
jgi:hypothetical protein